MRAETEILRAAKERLEELLKRPVRAKEPSSRGNGPDGVFQAGKYHFVVEAKSSNRLASVDQACRQAQLFARRASPGAVPLVVVPFMGPSGRQACDSAKGRFFDRGGNPPI